VSRWARRWFAVAGVLFGTGCGPASDEWLLSRSWQTYRTVFIAPEGRVVRPEHGHDTVSEGQAYAMLRAAWMDDRATFDRVWQWTRANLARTGQPWPALLAWRWSPASGVVDWNVASDADADVALALLVAERRWSTPGGAYRAQALAILDDLLDHAVVADDAGLPVFLPGAWADQRGADRGLVLNPSYLAPASFRVFHHATGDERWLRLAAGAYAVLDAICTPPAAALPPDWIRWWSHDRWAPDAEQGGLPGWDAIRVPWRVATDALWFGEPRARAYLARCPEPIARRHHAEGAGMAVEYGADGLPRGAEDHVLANAMFSFALQSPAERDWLLARTAGQVTRRGRDVFFGEPDRYYVNSLAYLPFLVRAGRYSPP
jgi:endoglucanase